MLACFFLTILSGCDALPRDPEGTLDHVVKTRLVRVGLTGMSDAERATAMRLVTIVANRTQAEPRIAAVTTEPGFAALDEGRLDLVIGPFERESPWKTDVAFGPPLALSGSRDHRTELKAAMRNGENRWIMLIEAASRQAAPEIANR